MRDAFGGLMNMVIIIVFLVLVSGYLAFNVNYTKACSDYFIFYTKSFGVVNK